MFHMLLWLVLLSMLMLSLVLLGWQLNSFNNVEPLQRLGPRAGNPVNLYSAPTSTKYYITYCSKAKLNPYPTEDDNPYLCKKCRSRSDRSHMIRIYTICHVVYEVKGHNSASTRLVDKKQNMRPYFYSLPVYEISRSQQVWFQVPKPSVYWFW